MTHSKKDPKNLANSDQSANLTPHLVHDFNNLLTIIGGNIELVMMSLKPGSASHEQARTALAAVNKASKMAKQLMSHAKRTKPTPNHLQISTLVRELTPMLQSVVGEDVAVKIIERDEPPPLYINFTEFENCLINLAANARDAMNNMGTLTIRLGKAELTPRDGIGIKPGTYAHIQISDTGSGISAEHLPHIFEPFYTTKDEDKGCGLGLAGVLGFVTRSQGFIDVETGKDIGTTFHLYFPEEAYETQVALRPFTIRDFPRKK
jgi:signal transduction histidine kinase